MAQPVQECVHPIVWVQQAAAAVATNGYPSGTSAGVAVPQNGNRRAIGNVYARQIGTLNATTLSSTLSFYGMTDDGVWQHLKDLNGGAAITVALQPRSSPDGAAAMTWTELVEGCGGGFARYYIRVDSISGTSYSLKLEIGFSVL